RTSSKISARSTSVSVLPFDSRDADNPVCAPGAAPPGLRLSQSALFAWRFTFLGRCPRLPVKMRLWREADSPRKTNVHLRRESLQAGLPASPMRNRQQLGDTPPDEFRKQLHELADWIADFREHIDQLRVAPNDKPGAIRAQLPKRAPEEGEPFE